MAEKYLENTDQGELWDYKFSCFHGKPQIMYISHEGKSDIGHLDFFDMDFNKLDISRRNFKQSSFTLAKPKNWALMKSLAAQLSAGFPHVRVDFYEADGQLYLGELTFFQGGGMRPFYPMEWDYKLGEMLDIEKVKGEIGQ